MASPEFVRGQQSEEQDNCLRMEIERVDPYGPWIREEQYETAYWKEYGPGPQVLFFCRAGSDLTHPDE
jgi:hypothetical protein